MDRHRVGGPIGVGAVDHPTVGEPHPSRCAFGERAHARDRVGVQHRFDDRQAGLLELVERTSGAVASVDDIDMADMIGGAGRSAHRAEQHRARRARRAHVHLPSHPIRLCTRRRAAVPGGEVTGDRDRVAHVPTNRRRAPRRRVRARARDRVRELRHRRFDTPRRGATRPRSDRHPPHRARQVGAGEDLRWQQRLGGHRGDGRRRRCERSASREVGRERFLRLDGAGRAAARDGAAADMVASTAASASDTTVERPTNDAAPAQVAPATVTRRCASTNVRSDCQRSFAPCRATWASMASGSRVATGAPASSTVTARANSASLDRLARCPGPRRQCTSTGPPGPTYAASLPLNVKNRVSESRPFGGGHWDANVYPAVVSASSRARPVSRVHQDVGVDAAPLGGGAFRHRRQRHTFERKRRDLLLTEEMVDPPRHRLRLRAP